MSDAGACGLLMNSHARQAMLNKANTISALQSLAGETDFCGVFMFIVTQGFFQTEIIACYQRYLKKNL